MEREAEEWRGWEGRGGNGYEKWEGQGKYGDVREERDRGGRGV